MRLVLCDDHRLLVETLAALLRANGHEVVACALTPDEAVRVVSQQEVDGCVMDIGFAGDDGQGLDGIRRVRAAAPSVKVVVLSASGEPEVIAAALRAGASAYLLKGEDVDRVLATIAALDRGDADDLPVASAKMSSPRGENQLRFMTPREREVLARLVQGQSTVTIAREMGVAYSTARTHIQNVLTKLGVHSKLAAVTYAVRNGLIVPRSSGSTDGERDPVAAATGGPLPSPSAPPRRPAPAPEAALPRSARTRA